MDSQKTLLPTDTIALTRRMSKLAFASLFAVALILLLGVIGRVSGAMIFARYIPGAIAISPFAIILLTLFTTMVALDVIWRLPRAVRLTISIVTGAIALLIFAELVILALAPTHSIEVFVLRLFGVQDFTDARISPITLLLSFISAAAIQLRQIQRLADRPPRLVGWLAVLAISITLIFMLGYAYSTPKMFGSGLLPIALPTCLAFLLLHTALLCELGPSAYPLNWFLDGTTRAKLLCLFVPFLIVIMPLKDWLLSRLDTTLHLSGAVTSAATSLIFTSIAVGLIILVARQVGRRLDDAMSALRQSEAQLQYESERLLVTLRSIGDGVIVTDLDGNTLLLNPVAEQLTGWTHDEAFGHPIATIFHIVNEDTREIVESPVAKVVESGVIVGLANHTVLIARDGREFAIADSGAPIRDADGTILGVILVFRDVTDERLAERLLQESEERFRLLFTAMTEGFALHEIICDADGRPIDYRFLDINPAFGALTGLDIEHAIGRTVRDVIPDIEDKWIEIYGSVATTGTPVQFSETATALGRTFDIYAYSPQPGQFATIFRDITERHRDEERLKVTLNSIGDGVIVTDAQGRVMMLNPVAEALTGWTQAESAGQPISVVFHIVNEDTRELVENPVAQVVESGLIVGLANHTVLIARDGREFAIADSGAPIRGADGGIIGVVLVFRDVTDERRAERALQQSEALLRASQQVAKVGHYVLDVTTDHWTSSEQLDELFGIDAAYDRSVAGWLQIVHPDDRAMMQAYFTDDVIGQRQPFDKEYRITRIADHSTHWMHGLGALEFSADGIPTRMFGTIQDITERKLAEEQTRLHLENLERLARISQYHADSIQELLDYALDEALQLSGSRLGYIYYYHADRQEFVLNTWSNEVMAACSITDPQTTYQLEKTGIWGEVVRQQRPIMVNDFAAAHPLKRGYPEGHAPLHNFLSVPIIADDKIVAVAGVANKAGDYTESDVHQLTLLMDSVWKMSERKRMEDEHRDILHAALDGFMIVDGTTLHCLEVNDALCGMLGYTADELLQLTIMDLEANETPAIVRQHANAMIACGYGRFASRFRRRDGSTVDVDQSIRYFPMENHFVVFARDITERITAEAELVRSRDFALILFDNFPDMIWRTDAAGQVNYVNNTWVDFTGRAREVELGEGWQVSLHPDDVEPYHREYLQAYARQAPFEFRYRLRRHDGEYRWLNEYGRPYTDLNGVFAGYLGVCRDITDSLLAEAQLRQAVKMESVGRLAGGVAHDFNNILTGIIGLTQLAQSGLPQQEPARNDLDEVLRLADRAANLTRQLLAFSRRQTIEPGYLNLNDLVAQMLKMLTRVIGEDITLHYHPAAQLGTVYADPGQIEQILLNLAVNARDAMPHGGTLTIETENIELDQDYAEIHAGVKTGAYVQLTITDTGEGMSPDVQQHIFEPFFTTKGVGQGTGLGLATVYGIVKQHNGNIWVYTEPGHGTCFKIYLPRVDDLIEPNLSSIAASQAGVMGHETLLLVEDEDAVRATIRRILESQGYRVVEAATPRAASALFAAHAEEIPLLVSDVIMPEQNGLELYATLLAHKPDLKALFVSGYSDNVLVNAQMLPTGAALIQKPFSRYHLLEKIREVLDAPVIGGIHDDRTH